MSDASPSSPHGLPDSHCLVRELFGLDSDWRVPSFAQPDEQVPTLDPGYHFDPDTTLAILAGFAHNRRVLIQGYHGSGKTSHIEQVAARLNWPCVRINLDSHISRMDLIGKDMIRLREGRQVTEFQPGMLTWALQHPTALIFDEYDAGRPDVMFVIQRVLELEGCLTLVDQSRVIHPHPAFRLFATANTLGMGDAEGLYHGTQPLNQGQLDRWNLTVNLNYLRPEDELRILLGKCPQYATPQGREELGAMITLAGLTRSAFVQGDLSSVMSPRTLISWAQNQLIFADLARSFRLSFFNRCDDQERPLLAEYYQRCMGEELISPPSPSLW